MGSYVPELFNLIVGSDGFSEAGPRTVLDFDFREGGRVSLGDGTFKVRDKVTGNLSIDPIAESLIGYDSVSDTSYLSSVTVTDMFKSKGIGITNKDDVTIELWVVGTSYARNRRIQIGCVDIATGGVVWEFNSSSRYWLFIARGVGGAGSYWDGVLKGSMYGVTHTGVMKVGDKMSYFKDGGLWSKAVSKVPWGDNEKLLRFGSLGSETEIKIVRVRISVGGRYENGYEVPAPYSA